MFGAPPPSLEGRVVALEKIAEHHGEKHRELVSQLAGISSSIRELTTTMTTIGVERKKEAEAATRWKNAALTVATATAVALLAWVAHIAMVVQTARAAGGAP